MAPQNGPENLLIMDLDCQDEDFSWQELITSESLFEEVLDYPDLAFRLHFPTDSQRPELKDPVGLEAWIKRHAKACNAIEHDLFCQGRIESLSESSLIWQLPAAAYQILLFQKFSWLQDFCQALFPEAPLIRLVAAPEPVDLDSCRVGQELLEHEALLAKRHVAPPPPPKTRTSGKTAATAAADGFIWGKKKPRETAIVKLEDLSPDTDFVRCRGQVDELEARQTKSGRYLVRFILVEGKSALRCLIWAKPEEVEELMAGLDSVYVEITGFLEWNERFEQDFQCRVDSIFKTEEPVDTKIDTAEEKRVELHLHTKFSAKDACSSPSDLVMAAARYGHPAVAITDHGVVQAFPEAQSARDKLARQGKDIKLIFGLEGYLVDDGPTVFLTAEEAHYERCQAIAALAIDYQSASVGEDLFGARRDLALGKRELKACYALKQAFSDGEARGQLQYILLEPDREIENAYSLNQGTVINAQGAKNSSGDFQTIDRRSGLDRKEALRELSHFLKDAALVSRFDLDDLTSLRSWGFQVEDHESRIKFNPAFLDLAALSRLKDWSELDLSSEEAREVEKIRSHIPYVSQASASTFAEEVWPALACQLRLVKKYFQTTEIKSWRELNQHCGHLDFEQRKAMKAKSTHIVLLANNNVGLYHLYRLVSLAHLEEFYFKPRIALSKLRYFRAGLTAGSACVMGEVFSAVLKAYRASGSDYQKTVESFATLEWKERSQRYDYLEIQPLANNDFLLTREDSGVLSKEDLRDLNRLVLELGKLYDRPVCATCDVHFLAENDGIYRNILISNMGFGESEEEQAPLYLRTTDEMLQEFSYLGEEKAFECVVTNTQAVADLVEPQMRAFPEGSYPPEVEHSADNLRRVAYENALRQYGRDDKLPEDIQSRLEQELSSVIDNGYAVMYDIARRMVTKSNEDGYSVGSRGSVGSSVLATFLGISEVNPLPPHYICENCHYYEVDQSGKYGSGFDLPDKVCPECGHRLKRDGQDIPFATFLGFSGNKQPDIDLNFSGEYQPRAHAYLEEMFGQDHTFRAGTVSSYGGKKAVEEVYNYCQDHELNLGANNQRCLAKGLEGIKISTGQHPGGIVVIPDDWEIYDFTPVQYPANKNEKGIITTHFDFHALEETILKIDALGHDDPTMLKYLSDYTGVAIEDIPIPDERVMQLFQTTAAIGIDPEESTIGSATIGLPEVGTTMARNMIKETQPSSFFDLVQLSGLSHGTGVWKGNAQDLIASGTCTINDVIGCRDSIMNTLIYAGLDPEMAFKIMETVRKGRDLKPEQIEAMRQHDLPDWYLDSCKKIQYLFPKAHAAAYSISTQRVAYFKVYYPEAFYSVWFTIRGDGVFSQEDHLISPEAIKARRLEQSRASVRLDDRDLKKFFCLELIEEMQARGINFLPLDLEKSDAHKFYSPEPGFIRPPLDVIHGISTSMAKIITEARDSGEPFRNIDELRQRANLGDSAINNLRAAGVLDHLPESAQISLFEMADMS
ncbi:MAG: PolC-type DNA polymerase III [Eubacteriales bacterium]|nr:PolC-type DNA polymerase III [Eubacteriales bacterium]